MKSPSSAAFRFDRAFVSRWSQRYANTVKEQELLTKIGPAVARRGYYKKAELAQVGDWKSPRIRKRLAQNSGADVEDITRIALAAPERLQHRVLGSLYGIRDPVATAVLTIWAPDRHTVLDFRAVEALDSLHRLGAIPETLPKREVDSLPDYVDYLACCRAIARRLGVDLRDLDRALWQWSKQGMPESI
jgi:hypothetical protein